MSKIVSAVRPNTAQKIAGVRRSITSTEAEIAELRTVLAAKLIDEDDTEAVALTQKIAVAENRLALHNDRLVALQKQKRLDVADDRQKLKDQALSVFEEKFSDRATAAARVDKAVAELGESLVAYRSACRAPFTGWSDTFPPFKIFEGYSYSHVERNIAGHLRMASPGSAHELLVHLSSRLGKLAEADISRAAMLIEDIKNSPLPKLSDEAA